MLDVGNGIEVVGDERSLANEVSCVKTEEVLPGEAGVIQRGFGYASIPHSFGAFIVECWVLTILVKG
jgi:hypothetical protein